HFAALVAGERADRGDTRPLGRGLGIGALAHATWSRLSDLLLVTVVILLVIDVFETEVHQCSLHKRSHFQPSSENPIVTACGVAGEDRTGRYRGAPSSRQRRPPARDPPTCPSRAL